MCFFNHNNITSFTCRKIFSWGGGGDGGVNPSGSLIPTVKHKLINYVRYRMYTYPLKRSRLFVYVFVMQLGKTTINVGNHQNIIFHSRGAGRSSEVERSLMVRWVIGSILHGVDPLSYFSFQPVLHEWCNKGRGMCYPVCGMVHIKEPLLLIDKSSLCGGSGFPFSLSEWSLTICLTPYNRK